MSQIIKSLDDYIEKLAQSCNIDCGTSFPSGVTKQAELFAKWFQEAGFYSETVDLGQKVGHGVFATNDPEAKAYDLLLSGHLDTVFKEGTCQERPFYVKGDKAYGPGVADMKSGDLAILWAISSLDEEILKRIKIAVCLNPDEETGSLHSSAWIDSYAKKSRYALVFESSDRIGKLTEQRKGIAHIDIFLQGVGAHAGFCPEKGRSAVDALAECIIRINALRTENVTVNFGVVDGGTIANAIAENAHARIDVRFWSNEQWDEFYSAFKKEFAKPFGKDIKSSFDILVLNKPMVKLPQTKDLKDLVAEAYARQGIEVEFVRSGGISDGNHISQSGTAVLDGLGPVGGDAHTIREWLDLTSVETSVKALQNIIYSL